MVNSGQPHESLDHLLVNFMIITDSAIITNNWPDSTVHILLKLLCLTLATYDLGLTKRQVFGPDFTFVLISFNINKHLFWLKIYIKNNLKAAPPPIKRTACKVAAISQVGAGYPKHVLVLGLRTLFHIQFLGLRPLFHIYITTYKTLYLKTILTISFQNFMDFFHFQNINKTPQNFTITNNTAL